MAKEILLRIENRGLSTIKWNLKQLKNNGKKKAFIDLL